jgi:aspartate/methionine/tyrosine aminotransferase
MQAVQTPVVSVVGELIRENPGTISLGQGVVSYGPPPESTEQITAFWSNPDHHKYQLVQGIPELLEAIKEKLQRENGIAVNGKNCVVVTAGGNMAFVNAVLAITDPSDEIIIQTPYYFNHEMAIAIADCKAVCVPTDENYQLQLEQIELAITPRTRAVVTISPNNPTGAVYAASDLTAVSELCAKQDIYHIHDEAYEYFTYEGAEHFSPASLPGSESHAISLFSLSKSYGFASWRIGYMVLPKQLYTRVKKIQDTILICPPVISQWAAYGAMQAGAPYCREQQEGIAENRARVLEALETIKHLVTVPPARGAFYFLLRVNTSMGPMELAERLIREYKVAVIPGNTFGIEEGCYLRLAYGALHKENAQEGIGRLVRGLREILS